MICEKATRKFPGGRTGTMAGHSAHRHLKEEPCKDCRYAYNSRRSKVSAIKQPANPEYQCMLRTSTYPAGATGTYAGMRRHEQANEVPCEPCAEAGRAYVRKAHMKHYYENRQDMVVRNMRRRSERKAWRHKPYTAKEITESFGTTCYLCEHEVDLQSKSGSPLSASIDHVMPLHITSGPGDQLSNVRWTHLRCNLRKGTRTVGQCALPFPVPKGDEF